MLELIKKTIIKTTYNNGYGINGIFVNLGLEPKLT